MKYLTVIFMSVIFTATSFPQFSVRGGMGISFVSMPSLTDYLNQNFVPSNQQLGSFNSSVIFSGEGYMPVSKNYDIGLEVAYLINSYTYNDITGQQNDFTYNILMPSLTGYYVISGTGFNFKFGAGIGPRFVHLNRTQSGFISEKYTVTGFGMLLSADGNTLLSGNLYANIGADLRYDFNGEPKNGGKPIINNNYGTNVNMNSFSVGLRLGVTYIF